MPGLRASPEPRVCACIGPQNGEPRCPCMMRGVIVRDGRWVQPEVDLGPVTEPFVVTQAEWAKFANSLKDAHSG